MPLLSTLTAFSNYHTVPYLHTLPYNIRNDLACPMNIANTFIVPAIGDRRLVNRPGYQMLVAGRSIDAASGKTITRESPGHLGKVVGEWPEASADDVRL